MNQNSQILSSTAAADEAAIRALHQQFMDDEMQLVVMPLQLLLKKMAIWWGFDGTHIKGRQKIA
jgi:hypothetical protein